MRCSFIDEAFLCQVDDKDMLSIQQSLEGLDTAIKTP